VTRVTPARYRRALGLLLLLASISLQPQFSAGAAAAAPRVTQEAAAQHESGASEAEGEGGWGSTIAKAFNFAALVAVLAYFLKSPIAGYLRARSDTIRKDLVEAASLRADSERQLADVRERLARLPAELEALQRRGQEELAQERIRLGEATGRERARVLDRTRREIDLQFRVARRGLLEHAAELSMRLARMKIERDITAGDQARLIERYAAEVRP
jgi:F0F1-type ATP synthase membrane subunit b/b'